MGSKVVGINGAVLKWARESLGMTLTQVAHSLKQTETTVAAWESGHDAPTYSQLEALAYIHYKRPLAVFFFPEPPVEKNPRPEFRLLPEHVSSHMNKDTLLAIREMQSKQESLRELTNQANPRAAVLGDLRQLNLKANLDSVCLEARKFLRISVETQFNWQNATEALKHWRELVEESGIFVFKRSFKDEDINGFCLTDPIFPIICINNSTTKSRQIFTLFHELAHLLVSENGFTKSDLNYMNYLNEANQRLEIWCNQFASEFLVPSSEFKKVQHYYDGSEESILAIASKFKVSREVIMRRLLQTGQVSQEEYELKRLEWIRQWQQRVKGPGGNFYATQGTYLGEAFIKLGFSNYYSGRATKEDLAGHFGIKVKQIAPLENWALGV